MDLKDRKKIKNSSYRNFLPGYDKGFPFAGGSGAGSSSAGNGMMGQIIGDVDYDFIINMLSSDPDYFSEYFDKYGTSTRDYGGFGYRRHNDMDLNKEISKIDDQESNTIIKSGIKESAKGAQYGSLGGPIGAAIGGVAGGLWGIGKGILLGDKEKEAQLAALKKAKLKQDAENFQWEVGAKAQKYAYDWSTKHGQYKGSYLGAYNGIEDDVDPEKMQTKHKHLVQTPKGVKIHVGNAYVTPGEIIDKQGSNDYHLVTGDPTKIDQELAYIPKGGRVASNNPEMPFPGTNNTFAEMYPLMKNLGQEDLLFDIQKQERSKLDQKNGLTTAYNGWENIYANVPAMIETAFDYNKINNEDIKQTNIRPMHPYAGVVQDLLNNRRVEVYPLLNDVARNEANTRYNINRSAHSSATKTLLNMTNSMNSRIARAKAFLDIENMRNQFAKEAAAIYNDMGKSLMSSNLAADQFNVQMNNAAHNAKVKMLSQKRADRQALRSQFARNEWERKQFDWMMNYYNQDQEFKNAYLNWLRGNKNNPNIKKKSTQKSENEILGDYLNKNAAPVSTSPASLSDDRFAQYLEQHAPSFTRYSFWHPLINNNRRK